MRRVGRAFLVVMGGRCKVKGRKDWFLGVRLALLTEYVCRYVYMLELWALKIWVAYMIPKSKKEISEYLFTETMKLVRMALASTLQVREVLPSFRSKEAPFCL